MILIIDNYDSFTYNLYQLIGELERDIMVKRNDEITIQEIKKLNPEKIIISPGPGDPTNIRDFGICMQVIKEFGEGVPILGVCLGHQGIFAAFNGHITHTEPVHGKQTQIFHDQREIFKGVENPLLAARYHSLTCNGKKSPDNIKTIAKTKEGMIMAIKHRDYPIFGLQFHPESIGTKEGKKILKNFLEIKA
jgi:anthranilate synthase component 2